jgi:flagellar protein FlaG
VTPSQRQELSQGGKTLPTESKEVDRAEQVSEIREASKTIESFVQNVTRELRFSVDADLGRTVVTVVDQNTDQVIRQIPGDEALAMAKYISEQSLAGVQGILVTEKA